MDSCPEWKNKMIKVLIALKNMNVGGVEKSLLSLLNTVDRTKYEVDLLLLEEYGGFLNEIPNWVNVIICKDYANIKDEVNEPPVRVIKTLIQNGRVGRAIKLLFAYVLTKITHNQICYYRAVFGAVGPLPEHYDVAISYTSIISYLTWFVRKRINADAYIGWIHFDVSKLVLDKEMVLYLHQGMKKIYVVSKAALNSFTTVFPQLKDVAELRYNIVDPVQITTLAMETSECIREPNAKTIVTLGMLTKEKGQDIVPEVAVKLKTAGIAFKWYLIGDGGLRTTIEKRAKVLGVGNEVIMLGTQMNPYPYLSQADVYVQTSIHEGFCITLAEAKVFNIPIISTDCAGAHEQLDERLNCMVVERDVSRIYEAIRDVLEMG